MWFRSVYLRTLRSCRIAILGWGIGMALVVLVTAASASTLVGTAEGRAALTGVASSLTWNAAPVALGTVAGYTTWKIGITILLMAVWPLLAGSRILRGEEERGSLDVLLSAPRGRVRVALEKIAAMWTALLAMGVLMGLVVFAGTRSFSPGFGLGDALLFGLNLALICAVVGGVALFVSQFTVDRRRAAGWTGGLLLVFIVLDMLHRVTRGTEWISRISPVYYYNLSKPLIVSYGTNPGAMLVLLGLTLVLSGAAVWLFTLRDVGAAVPLPGWLRLPARADRRRGTVLPAGEWSLRSVYARSMGMIAAPAFWWTVGIAGFAALMVAAVKQIEGNLGGLTTTSSPVKSLVQNVGGGGNIATNATLLGAIFFLLPVLLMAFAVTQVNRWSADEDEGRLELVLSTPQSRPRVLLGRFAALGTATVVIGVLTLVSSAAAASAAGLKLDGGHLAAATLGMIPLGLLIAAIGYLGSGWLRSAADTGLLSLLLVAFFCITFLGPDLKLPDAALRLSALYYYGTPLLHGMQLTSVLGILGVSILALALGSWRFAAKDIGR